MPLTHPRLVELWEELAATRAALSGAVATLSPEDWHRGRGGPHWCPAQIIEHLGRVEGSIAKMLEGPVLAAALPPDPSHESVRGSLDHVRLVDRSRRVVAPARLAPEPEVDGPAAWDRLQAVRARSRLALEALDGRDLGRFSAPHPLFGPFSGYQWVLMIAQHEARHLAQLREVLAG